ncbi:GNAT family N-acetyltransferase [Demequina sp. NBRC 110056]|uniref:GNAT family N-acetyltransferase n=1 Tax=Demequina sp. NBRC 110056 TaxID=1570345 RepID=UPI000A02D547|nr:GNAT family N-acetyltransferase [Demequina sp. NBRC 110056]
MAVRPATAADAHAIERICLLTGDNGTDATGLFCDDAVLADVYALPYLTGPGGFCLVWDEGAGAVGYVLGTDDTPAFQRWFTGQWWPSRPGREQTTEGDRWLLPSAADPDRMINAAVDAYPAHLHIDLLPEAQGRGAGRALIEAACALLAERGSPGVHLEASQANAGAQAFYPRVGFEALATEGGSVTFARRLAP